MSLAGRALVTINRGLRRAGVELRVLETWDRHFARWVREARRTGQDPNDVAEGAWGNPLRTMERFYLPHIKSDHTVLELGPGSGRLTRHVIQHCSELIAVDSSRQVCKWLTGYLRGKGAHRIIHTRDWLISEVADQSVDFVFAHGVFEHLDPEFAYGYLKSFRRVMRPGARGAFNFNTLMSEKGFEWFEQTTPGGGWGRSIFRFYHPDNVERLLSKARLEPISIEYQDPAGRQRYATFQRRG